MLPFIVRQIDYRSLISIFPVQTVSRPRPDSISLRLKSVVTLWSEGFSPPISLLLAPVPFGVWLPIEPYIGSYCATLSLRSLLCAVRPHLSSLYFEPRSVLTRAWSLYRLRYSVSHKSMIDMRNSVLNFEFIFKNFCRNILYMLRVPTNSQLYPSLIIKKQDPTCLLQHVTNCLHNVQFQSS
jgi:hypothetical protein